MSSLHQQLGPQQVLLTCTRCQMIGRVEPRHHSAGCPSCYGVQVRGLNPFLSLVCLVSSETHFPDMILMHPMPLQFQFSTINLQGGTFLVPRIGHVSVCWISRAHPCAVCGSTTGYTDRSPSKWNQKLFVKWSLLVLDMDREATASFTMG